MQTSHDPGSARGPQRVCARWLQNGLLVLVSLLGFAVARPGLSEEKKSATQAEQLAFGVKMAQRGLWSEALFRFQQAARLKPSDPKVLNNLAVAHEALGLFDQALEIYREALRVDPNNQTLRRNYARFVEFYQSFKPPAEGEKGEASENGEEADETDETDETEAADPGAEVEGDPNRP